MAEKTFKIDNKTTVKTLDNAIKFWSNAKSDDPKVKQEIEDRVKKLKAARLKIIKYYREVKAAGLIDTSTMTGDTKTAFEKANLNNFEDLTYDMVKAIKGDTDCKNKIDQKIKVSVKNPLSLMTAVKACAVGGAISLAASAGGFSLIGAAFSGLFLFSPGAAIALGGLAIAGLVKGFKKLFGKEWSNVAQEIKKHKDFDDAGLEAEDANLEAEIEGENQERQNQENQEKQDKQDKINALKQKAENMKGTIYSQEDLDNLRAEMAAEGMSNDEIEQATAALNNYEEEFNAVKGNDAARGQLVDFKKEYDKVVEMISKGTVTNAQIEAAIAKLSEIANGTAELQGDSGNYKLNIEETKTMAGRLVSIVNELYQKRKDGIKKGETANVKNDIEKFHGIEGLDGLTK